LAYQGYGEGLNLEIIESITRQSTDEKYMNPDIAVILDLDDETERSKRIGVRGNLKHPDTFESKSDTFQSKVRTAYLDIAKSRTIPVVSANQTVAEMTNDLWAHIKPHTNC
jgi:dTMP kinase